MFHYVPLHNSIAGRKYGKTYDNLLLTQELSDRLVRLPLWVGMEESVEYVIQQVIAVAEHYESRE